MVNPKRRATKAKRRRVLKDRAERKRAARAKYPSITVKSGNASPEFVSLFEQAIGSLDFDSFEKSWKMVYQGIKESGAESTLNAMLYAAQNGVRQMDRIRTDFMQHLGRHLYESVGRHRLKRHLPFEDAQVLFVGQNIVIACKALEMEKSSYGRIYFNPNLPRICFGGEELVLGWSRHSIERLAERVVGDPLSYGGAGDVFARLHDIKSFELVTLPSGQQAIRLYDSCVPGHLSHGFAEDLEGVEQQDKTWSYVVGYCPVVVCDGFLKVKTLLFPGYTGTPEDSLMERSALNRGDRAKLKSLVRDLTYARIADTGDISCLKWFHENGCPQVKQLRE